MDLSSLFNKLSNKKNPVHVHRSGFTTAAKLATELLKKGQSFVIVAKNQEELQDYRAAMTLFSSDDSAVESSPGKAVWQNSFVCMPRHPAARGGKSGWAERMAALYALRMQGNTQGCIVTLDNFLLRLPPLDIFDKHEIRLYRGMEMSPELVLEQAIDWGYVRSPMVSLPGEISVRGDIVDIFCPGYTKPLRFDFFGDLLEEIRIFDLVSQRSLGNVEEIHLLPVAPVIPSKILCSTAESFWKKIVKQGRLQKNDVEHLKHTLSLGGIGVFSGMFYEDSSCLEEWFGSDAVYILPQEAELFENLEHVEREWTDFLHDEGDTKGFIQPKELVLRPKVEVENLLKNSPRVIFTNLRIGVPEEQEDSFALPEKTGKTFQEFFPDPKASERPWQHLVAVINEFSKKRSNKDVFDNVDEAEQSISKCDSLGCVAGAVGHKQLVLSFSSERARKKFLNLAQSENIHPKLRYSFDEDGVFAVISPLRHGVILDWCKLVILGEDVLQPRVESARRVPKGVFQGLDTYDTLKEGDFIVHRDYGVAAFGGLHRMNLGGTAGDYLLLKYTGDDKLYLPVDRLSLIQRFKSTDSTAPVLDKLGGSLWSTSKEKARKAIEKIAADLVEMYALRKVMKGFRYQPVSEMYREFEASFGFEETPDQAKAIEDVLNDMEKDEPMDRLICGDVGFGKTEVALRASFRAASEGRQVAFLCPTTILAEQHYQTFRSRLAGFPINVGMLSRFVSKAKQKEVLAAAAKGQIDILVGTHRLLSKDVILPNLGLLILDEEQRFGVRHKERLKSMRQNIDALTLTATPIPRTLQLSLSGIRELSIIETPPLERKPVVTALIDRDDKSLKEIMERELARQGQVFWVYNRVQGLERVGEYVKKLVPHARIGMAHGQMHEKDLEETMHKFWHGELDILLCTAIIESGLDFPRANTLIVDQAQMFGLGQLYQLRGRVGRSDKQAFAIFVTPDPDKLPEIARQRMRIILEMDYLGAGFQVAMEDLRLRGAGNILGESQSGHMNRLGLELFLEMLEEAVAKLKGQKVQTFVETELNIGIPAFIPESYMQDAKDRLRYYKSLSSAQDQAAQEDYLAEIRDRFGKIPLELANFAAVLSFKRFLKQFNVSKADIYADKVRLAFASDTALDPAKLVTFVAKLEERKHFVRLQPPATLEIGLQVADIPLALENTKDILKKYLFN